MTECLINERGAWEGLGAGGGGWSNGAGRDGGGDENRFSSFNYLQQLSLPSDNV